MSQNYAGSPGRILRPESAEINSPIIEPVGSPGHAAALLARINARARARKEGLIKGTKSPSLAVKENIDTVKTDKSLKEKKFLTKDNLVRTGIEKSLNLDTSNKSQINKLNELNSSEKCVTVTPTKELNEKAVILTPTKEFEEKTVIEFVVDATEETESLLKIIKNKLKNDVSEDEQQLKKDEKDISKKNKKKKRKDIPEYDTVDSFKDDGKVVCSPSLELQPLKKKKKKRTNSENEIEHINKTENDIENNFINVNLNKVEDNNLEAQIRGKQNENEDEQKEPTKKNITTGFEDFFCITEEKECSTNNTHFENEALEVPSNKCKAEKLAMKMEMDEIESTGKDSSVKEAVKEAVIQNLPTCEESLNSQDKSKTDITETIQKPEFLLNNDEVKKRKRKKKNKNKDKDSSEKDGNNIEGFTMMGEVQTVKKGKVQRVLPFWLSHPTVIKRDLQQGAESVDSIRELDAKLVHVLKEQKITSFFPIQKWVIPQILAGASSVAARYRPRDICVSAPTGSGKTLAFVLPIVQALSGRTVPRIRALVLLPVQELAIQVYKVFLTYVEHMGLNVGLAVGLKSFAKEQSSLIRKDASGYHSLVDILVATPGKLSDHLQLTKGIDLTYLRYLVLDEADRMLAADGGEWVERIEKAVSGKLSHGPLMGSFPPPGSMLALPTLPLQHLLFSATLSHDPEQLQHLTLYRPKLFTVTAQGVNLQTKDNSSEELVGVYTRPAELCEQFAVVEGTIKPLVLHHLATTNSWQRTLVFTNTTESTHKLATLLQMMAKDLTIKEFSSRHKKERKQIISQFKAGKIDMLISTDAMARGLDVPDIEQVVSYDVTSTSTYVHRIGRTARAGKTGTALSFVTKDDVGDYKNMLSQGGGIAEEISVPMEELEIYEEMYKEALFKMKDTLLQEKHNKRNEVEGNKGKHKGRINNKQGLRKGIKRLQNGKAARFPGKN